MKPKISKEAITQANEEYCQTIDHDLGPEFGLYDIGNAFDAGVEWAITQMGLVSHETSCSSPEQNH